MNKNSEKIAIGSFMVLLVTLVILALIMTAEHFQWIETNLLGAKTETTGTIIVNDEPVLEINLKDTKMVEFEYSDSSKVVVYNSGDTGIGRAEEDVIDMNDMNLDNKDLEELRPTIVKSFGGQNTGVFEYKEGLNGITVTTKDGTTYTFFEQEDGSWVRR